jgi:hypothetical protein
MSAYDTSPEKVFAQIMPGVLAHGKSKENRVFNHLKQHNEGKNEKNHSIHNHFDGIVCLHSVPDPDT